MLHILIDVCCYGMADMLYQINQTKPAIFTGYICSTNISFIGSAEDRGVFMTILSDCVIKWYDLKQLLLRQLLCQCPFS